MTGLRFVGRPAQAVDGLAKIMGKIRFIGDIRLPGMLHARVLRSQVPHARIVRLDVAPALKVPGVVACITSEDFQDHGLWSWPIKDQYMLAYQKLLYVGNAIAAVAAETPEAAQAGIQAIAVELDELPGVFDVEEALAPGAPQIPLVSPTGQGNLCETVIVRYSEPDPILQACAAGPGTLVYDETFRVGRQEHAYMETEAALAIPYPDGSVTVTYNGQSPFICQNHLCSVLGLPPEKVRVIQAPVGGSFGGKDDLGYQTSGQVAALALKSGRPVRLVLGREESMIASYKREPMSVHFRLGVDAEGSLQAATVDMLADSGCYSSQTPLAVLRAALHAAGPYRYRAVHVDMRAVYTNNGFTGAFRGFGNTDAAAAVEQAIDDLAHRLGRDPIDFRLLNCVRPGDRFMTGNVVTHDFRLTECLEWVRQKSDWDRKRAAYPLLEGDIRKGLGVACYMHGSSLGGEGADYAVTALKIEEDYSITLASGLTDYGPGSRTVFTLVAAEVLGVDPARIRVLRTDTDTAPESGPTVASRTTMLGGNATRVASEKLDRLLLYAAAQAFGCTPERVVRHGDLYVGPGEDELRFEQVVDKAREMGLVLSVQGKWSMPYIEWHPETGTGTPYYCYTFGAQAAEVEVDTLTGQVKVSKIWAAHDGGRIIFPQGAYGQFYGGIAQGLGYALLEEMNYYQGYPQSLNFDTYLVPTALDLPEIEATFIEADFPEGPFGARNLAEPVLVATAPAIANAVFHATGVRHHTLPLTLERVLLGQDLQSNQGEIACRRALRP